MRIKICEFVSSVFKANGLSYRSLGHRPRKMISDEAEP